MPAAKSGRHIFCRNEWAVYAVTRYDAFIRMKSLTNCGAHFTESLLGARSGILTCVYFVKYIAFWIFSVIIRVLPEKAVAISKNIYYNNVT